MKKKSGQGLFKATDGTSYLRPFALITLLFLLWGFAHGLLDVLDKHFQDTLHVSKAESGFVQFSLYIGYLAMAYPAGLFMKRYGYKKGIILGLSLFALGAFLFYPAAASKAYGLFLGALFILATGITLLHQREADRRHPITYTVNTGYDTGSEYCRLLLHYITPIGRTYQDTYR